MIQTDRGRVRGLLLVVFVPVLIVIGVLTSEVVGQSDSGAERRTALPQPVTGVAPPVMAPAPPAPVPAPPPAPVAPPVSPEPAAEPLPGAAPSAEPAFAPDTRDAPAGAERIDVGEGAQGAAIFRAAGSAGLPGPVVIFLHGWVAIDPARYGAWIRHLVRQGSTVIFPAYQTKPAYDTTTPLSNVLAGVRAALGYVLLAPGRLVVAGHSAGGALAADYAAVAADHGLPVPAAVYSVYPGRKLSHLKVPIPTVDLMQIAPGTRILVLVGERDSAVGSGTAQRIVAGAGRADAELLTIRDDAVDRHRAPRSPSAAAQRTFWTPLDTLIAATERANRSAPVP